MRIRNFAFILLASILISAPAFAWGEKGHTMANDAATFGTPNELPVFFHMAYPELIALANDPDRWRGGGPALEAVNPPDHFLDYEYVSALDLPASRYEFLHLLETSGTLRRYGISNSTSGFLPWKIAEMSDLLTALWRMWRISAPGSLDRRTIEDSIVETAGVLGHYVADAANPHHTTYNYNGWILPNPGNYANDCDTHARFESSFVSRSVNFEDVLPLLDEPKLRTDYFAAAMALIRSSNGFVETVYQLDRDNGFTKQPPPPEAKAFAASRIAAGASLLRDLWWSAWRNSGENRTRGQRR